jgi:hypothetical protein
VGGAEQVARADVCRHREPSADRSRSTDHLIDREPVVAERVLTAAACWATRQRPWTSVLCDARSNIPVDTRQRHWAPVFPPYTSGACPKERVRKQR